MAHEVFTLMREWLDFRDWASLRASCRLARDHVPEWHKTRSVVLWGISDGYLYHAAPYKEFRGRPLEKDAWWIRMGTRLLRVPAKLSTSLSKWDTFVDDEDYNDAWITGPYLGYQDVVVATGGGHIVIIATKEYTMVHDIPSGFYTPVTRRPIVSLAYWPDSPVFYGYDKEMMRVHRYKAALPSDRGTYCRRWSFSTPISKIAMNQEGLVTIRPNQFTGRLHVWATRGDVSREFAMLQSYIRVVEEVKTLDSGYIVILHGRGYLTVVERDLTSLRMEVHPYVGIFLFTFGDTIVTTKMVINAATKRVYLSRFLTNCRKGIRVGRWLALQDWNGTCKYYY